MNDRNLEAVARALAAGRAVDWDHVEVDVPDPAAAALLQELRVVAEIASFHKSPATPHRDVPAHIASDHWGRLRITRLIGSGSFGDVFEAYEPALDRLVALKLLRCAGTTTDALNAEVIEEGRTLARVRHPHVVTVFGAARIDGSAGIWMELIHGRTLASRVAELGPMDATDAARTVRDVCLGLAAVHDAGVVHRDVKAQNVMQDERGRVVLMDFGASLDASTGETALAGTPAYVAPEILCGSQATFQSDIYSVGVLLFYLTTGSYPVSGASVAEVRSRHAQGSRVALRQANARLPRSLAAIVDRALAQTPGDRFASARELADALDGFQRTAFRRPAAVFATALIACTAIAGLAISARVPKKSPSGGMRPMVLVGSFDNRTGTPLFNGTIEAALQYALARSSRLTVMPSTRIDDALNLMKRSPDTPLTPVLARDVARRDGGVAFLIVGTVDKVDADTVISAQIVPAAGAAMPQWVRVHASSDAEAPAAVWELAREIRARLGDARDAATRQGGRPISLDSVRSYTDAVRLGNRGQWRGALEQARQAAIDHRASAMAQIWLAWCEFNTRAREEGLRTAAAAESAAQGDEVPNDEREWILGSAADLRGDSERAVRHYENVLKDRPDDAWIVNRTAILYYNAGATAQAVMMGGRAADLRPNDFHQQVLATRWLLQAGDDAARVAHYAQRALRLLDKDTANALPIDASFALLVPAELAWRARDATGTSNALVAVLSDPRVAGTKLADPLFEHVAALYLAMGRIASAREIMQRVGLAADREVLLAEADYFAGDLAAEQKRLDRVCTPAADRQASVSHFPICTALLLGAGRAEDADALLKQAEARWDPVHTRVALGEMAAARHDPDTAIQMLAGTIDRLNPGSSQYLRGLRALSDAWLQKQERDTAIGALLSGLRHPHNPDPGAPLEATALSFRLAALYRSAGKAGEATRIEATAARGLERADPGFVDRLRALAAASLEH